jgi:hypothetical protein
VVTLDLIIIAHHRNFSREQRLVVESGVGLGAAH